MPREIYSDHPNGRSKQDRIARLRKRIENMQDANPELVAVLKGVLDLLGDEL